jgi:hypothetical protein
MKEIDEASNTSRGWMVLEKNQKLNSTSSLTCLSLSSTIDRRSATVIVRELRLKFESIRMFKIILFP